MRWRNVQPDPRAIYHPGADRGMKGLEMAAKKRRRTSAEKAEYDFRVARYKQLTGKERIHGVVVGCPDGWKYCQNPKHYREERN